MSRAPWIPAAVCTTVSCTIPSSKISTITFFVVRFALTTSTIRIATAGCASRTNMAFFICRDASVPAGLSNATYWVSICYHTFSPFIRLPEYSHNCNIGPCNSAQNYGCSHDSQCGLQVDHMWKNHFHNCKYIGQFRSSLFHLLIFCVCSGLLRLFNPTAY